MRGINVGGYSNGILRGVEITEEDFYWIIENPKTGVEEYMSCVGEVKELDFELQKHSELYENIEKFNKTSLGLAFINGALWREENPTPKMIQRILDLAWNYREDDEMTNIEYIIKNFNKR